MIGEKKKKKENPKKQVRVPQQLQEKRAKKIIIELVMTSSAYKLLQ